MASVEQKLMKATDLVREALSLLQECRDQMMMEGPAKPIKDLRGKISGYLGADVKMTTNELVDAVWDASLGLNRDALKRRVTVMVSAMNKEGLLVKESTGNKSEARWGLKRKTETPPEGGATVQVPPGGGADPDMVGAG